MKLPEVLSLVISPSASIDGLEGEKALTAATAKALGEVVVHATRIVLPEGAKATKTTLTAKKIIDVASSLNTVLNSSTLTYQVTDVNPMNHRAIPNAPQGSVVTASSNSTPSDQKPTLSYDPRTANKAAIDNTGRNPSDFIRYSGTPVMQNDLFGRVLETTGDLAEHSENIFKFTGNEKLAEKISSGNKIVTMLSLTNHVMNEDWGGAVKDIGEIGISKTPIAPYYYGLKTLRAYVYSDYMQSAVYQKSEADFHWYLSRAHQYRMNSDWNNYYMKMANQEYEIMESIKLRWRAQDKE